MFKNNGSHKHKIVDITDNAILTSPRTQLIDVPLSMLYVFMFMETSRYQIFNP
jgi:hypothetical protein